MMDNYDASPKSRSMLSEVYTQKRGTCVTVVILGIIICIFAFAYITFGNEPITDAQRINHTLKLVSIIVHHGQTPPIFTYPKDPFSNDTRWESSLGELSKKGKQNMHNLGKYFRERYSSFLPEIYYSADFKAISSNVDTCLMSMAVLLAGLYPPHKFQIWNPHILWQPIPVKGISEEVDNMIDLTQNCSTLLKMKHEIENAKVKEYGHNLTNIFDYLTEHTGMTVKNLTTVLNLYNLLHAQEKSGLPLPEWSPLIYPKMLNYSIKALEVETENKEITKLSTGILLEKIILDMQRKNSSKLSSKMFMYSTREKSIFNVLHILNRDKIFKPDYSTSLIIELHVIKQQPVVQVYYLDKIGKPPQPVSITECGDPCLFSRFLEITQQYISPNWKKDCVS